MKWFQFMPYKQVIIKTIAAVLLAAAGVSLMALPAYAFNPDTDCPKYYFNLLFENDLFGGGSDKHFTQGGRFSFVEVRPEKFADQFEDIEKDPNLNFQEKENQKRGMVESCLEKRGRTGQAASEFNRAMASLGRKLGEVTVGEWLDFDTNNVSFIFGQSMFTPEDITRKTVVADDRPFAGWLYIGWGFLTKRKPVGEVDVFDSFEIDLGIVGPQAYAGEIQDWWHRNVTNSPRPGGWPHQLKNEPGILMTLERKWRAKLPLFSGWLSYFELDALPNLGMALGNVFTYGAAGGLFRLGHNLESDYGPPRIRPGAQGSDFFNAPQGHPFYWYLYGGVEGRAVVRNIFLDGNTFTDSHRVDKKGFVGDFHVGLVVAYSCFRLALTEVLRSEEFEQQKERDEFGAISLSVVW